MLRERKPCPHVSEAGRIADMVLRHQSNFERRDLRIAKRIRFLIDSGEFVAVRTCDEIDAALESWRDALLEMGVIA